MQILRVLIVLLSSSVITILAGVVRQKVLAVELGPEGVGQLGLLLAFAGAVATLCGLGIATSGVQRVTVTQDTPQAGAAEWGLLLGSLLLGLLAGLGGAALAPLFGLPDGGAQWAVGMAAFLTILSSGQLALLNGRSQIHRIAWINGLVAVLGTMATVVLLKLDHQWGVHAALLSAPLLTTLLAAGAQRRLPTWPQGAVLGSQMRAMVALGAVFAAGTGLAALGQYAARWYIGRRFGEESLGHFQAAWGLNMLYLGVLLSAMSTEFFPRISRATNELQPKDLTQVVSRQILLTLGLALPAICLLVLLSDWVINRLYSAEFSSAAQLVRQQTLGDLFKLAAWAIGFTLLARQAKRAMLLLELLWAALYLLLLWLLTRSGRFDQVGWAYAVTYATYLVASGWAYWRHVGVALPVRLWAGVSGAAALVGFHIWAVGTGREVWTLLLATLDISALAVAAWWFWRQRRAGMLSQPVEHAAP